MSSDDINQHVVVGCLRDGCVCDPTFGKCTRCYAADTIQVLSDRAEAAEARAERLQEALDRAGNPQLAAPASAYVEMRERAERLRVALEEIACGRYSGLVLMSIPPQDPAVVRARRALEGDKQ